MKPLDCPVCEARIRPADVNLRRDVASCGACGHGFTLSDHLPSRADGVLRYGPPFAHTVRPEVRGISYREVDGDTATITAWVRPDLFAICFALVWTGGLVAATILAFASPEAEEQWLGFVLALIPFYLVSALLLAWSVFSLFGRHRIDVGRDGGELFSGAFGIGLRRRFDPTKVRDVEYYGVDHPADGPERSSGVVITTTDGRLSFRARLPEKRLQSLAVLLRATLLGDEARKRKVARPLDAKEAAAVVDDEPAAVNGVEVRSLPNGFVLTARVRHVALGLTILVVAGAFFWWFVLPFVQPLPTHVALDLATLFRLLGIGVVVVLGAGFLGFVAFFLFGVCRVRVEGDCGEVRTSLFGVGPRRRFDCATVINVRERRKRPGEADKMRDRPVVIERTTVPLAFGSGLNEAQAKAVVIHLRRRLLKPSLRTDACENGECAEECA